MEAFAEDLALAAHRSSGNSGLARMTSGDVCVKSGPIKWRRGWVDAGLRFKQTLSNVGLMSRFL